MCRNRLPCPVAGKTKYGSLQQAVKYCTMYSSSGVCNPWMCLSNESVICQRRAATYTREEGKYGDGYFYEEYETAVGAVMADTRRGKGGERA